MRSIAGRSPLSALAVESGGHPLEADDLQPRVVLAGATQRRLSSLRSIVSMRRRDRLALFGDGVDAFSGRARPGKDSARLVGRARRSAGGRRPW